MNFRKFLLRRIFRLYPALLALIAVYALFSPFLYPNYSILKHYQDVVLAGFYLSDYARSFDVPLSVLNHTWSLSAEMHFYMLWPFMLVCLVNRKKTQLQVILFLMWLAATGWRWYGFFWFEDGWDIYNRLDTHCSGLILGSLLSTVKRVPSKSIGIAGWLLVSTAVFVYGWRMEATALFGFSLAEIGTALVILSPPYWLGNALLAWVGKMSYGIYLWHYPIIRVMRDFDVSWHVFLLAGLLVGLLFAAVSYYLVEQPFIRYRKIRYPYLA